MEKFPVRIVLDGRLVEFMAYVTRYQINQPSINLDRYNPGERIPVGPMDFEVTLRSIGPVKEVSGQSSREMAEARRLYDEYMATSKFSQSIWPADFAPPAPPPKKKPKPKVIDKAKIVRRTMIMDEFDGPNDPK